MKVLAFLAGLALTAPVYAQPVHDYDRRTDESYREHNHQWFDVAGEVRSAGGAQSLPVRRGGIDRLRIEATRGRPYIQQVRVQYLDGSGDAYTVNRRLDRPGETVDIELKNPGRPIQRLVILSPRGHAGAYRVLAE